MKHRKNQKVGLNCGYGGKRRKIRGERKQELKKIEKMGKEEKRNSDVKNVKRNKEKKFFKTKSGIWFPIRIIILSIRPDFSDPGRPGIRF